MEDFQVLKTLSSYKKEIDPTTNSKFKKEKEIVNKIEHANFTNIILTNEKYKEKMNRSKKENKSETFTNKSDFNNFIEQDIVNMKKNYQWKRLPKSWQSSMCEDYIMNDDTIDEFRRSKSLENLNRLIPHVVYNKGVIKSINYEAMDAFQTITSI